MTHIRGNKYDSKHALSFSKNIKIVRVLGPIRHNIKFRGFGVIVHVHDVNTELFSTYRQDYETVVHAFIRATYYRLYRLYHNTRYRLWRY